jgi:hypothetical protein
MPAEIKWRRARGSELVEALAGGGLSNLLSDRSAVYMWKRNLRGLGPVPDAIQLVHWLGKQVATPNGRVSSSRISHFLAMSEIRIQAAEMSNERKKIFLKWFQKADNRIWMTRYMTELSSHLPALYVGETGDLCERTKQHLKGQTDFGADVESLDYLGWDDLDLFYLDLGPKTEEPSSTRRAIEYITTAVTIGGFTRRPG